MNRMVLPEYKLPVNGQWRLIKNDWLTQVRREELTLYSQLNTYIARWQRNPIAFALPHGPPHPKFANQGLAFWNDYEHDLILLTAPNQCGKTYGGAVYTILRSIPTDPSWPVFKQHGVIHRPWRGPQIVMIATYSWGLMPTIWNTYRELLPREELGQYALRWGEFEGEKGKQKDLRFHTQAQEITLKCGTRLIFMCYRQSLSQFESRQADIVHLDEQAPEDHYDAVSQRQITRGDYTPIIMTLTGHVIPDRPDTGSAGWIKRKVVDKGITKGRRVGFYNLDIPSTPDIIMTPKRKKKLHIHWVMEPEKNRDYKKIREAQARYHGGWEEGGGLWFDQFDKDYHVLPEFDVFKYKPTLYRMIDHGLKPMAVGFFAVMPWGDTVLYDEIYEDFFSIEHGVQAIVAKSGSEIIESNGYKEERFGENRFALTEMDMRSYGTKSPETGKRIGQVYNDCGLGVAKASGYTDKTLIPLAQELFTCRTDRPHINQHLKLPLTEEQQKRGGPRLYIFQKCQGMISELLQYIGKDKDDHMISCLTGDTMVACEDGDKPIKDVKAGDSVLTRQGYKLVLDSQMTNPAADIIELVCSDGTTLRGTADHPVYVPMFDKFVPMGSIPHLTVLKKFLSVVDVYECERKEPVYNLQVADAPEFFANGILVHNCLKFFAGRDRPHTEDYYKETEEEVTEDMASNYTGY